jgi:hypothetical protein
LWGNPDRIAQNGSETPGASVLKKYDMGAASNTVLLYEDFFAS